VDIIRTKCTLDNMHMFLDVDVGGGIGLFIDIHSILCISQAVLRSCTRSSVEEGISNLQMTGNQCPN